MELSTNLRNSSTLKQVDNRLSEKQKALIWRLIIQNKKLNAYFISESRRTGLNKTDVIGIHLHEKIGTKMDLTNISVTELSKMRSWNLHSFTKAEASKAITYLLEKNKNLQKTAA